MIGTGVFIVLLIGIWVLIFRKSGMFPVREGIPNDAVFVLETPSFDRIRDKLYRNKIWTSLKEYPYFEAYHSHLNQIDSITLALELSDKALHFKGTTLPNRSHYFALSAKKSSWLLSEEHFQLLG